MIDSPDRPPLRGRGRQHIQSLLCVSCALLVLLALVGCNHSSDAGTTGNPSGSDGKQSLSNLKRLGLGLNMWVQEHNETYPSMNDPVALKQALMPYIKDESTFLQPDTQQLYQLNASLSGKPLSSITDPAHIVTFYETQAASDGTRGVGFVDGHAERISESAWSQIKSASNIP